MFRTLARFLAGPRRAPAAAAGAAAVCAMLLSLTVLLTDPPYATGDELPHVDHAVRVWHGELPVFEEGLRLRPDGAWVAPVQWTAQHPPLYYLIVAPLAGPLADAGHPVAAVYAARALNMLLAGALVLAVWWSARRLCRPGSPVPQFATLVAGLAAAVAHAGGSAYNDLLATLLVTTMFGVSATAIRHGLDARVVVVLSLLAAGCALTRLSTALIAVVVAGFAVLAGSVRAAQGRGRWGPVAGLAVGGPVTVLAAAGWFYARNLALTGNIQGSHFDWALEHQNRVVRPLGEVVLDRITWARLPDLFWWAGRLPPRTPYTTATLQITALLLVWTPLVMALVARIRRAGRLAGARPAGTRRADVVTAASRRRPAGRPAGDAAGAAEGRGSPVDRWLLAALPWTAVVVAVTVQVMYGASGGGLYPRYLLPVALPLFLGVAAGLAWRPRLLVPLWAGVATADLVVWLVLELTTPPQPGFYAEPVTFAAVAGVLAVAGSAGATVSALRAHRSTATTAPAPSPAAPSSPAAS